ncbi:MAG: GPR endopeptidase [Firmicutes bacterium]|jgi:spore protease|nr:GPR endopeptidase [Bacillota bacterium]
MKKQKQNKIAWNFSPRTDLAIEAREFAQQQKQNTEELDGVKVEIKNTDIYQITHVKILNETGSQTMGKPIGNYITIESELLKQNDITSHEQIMKTAAEHIAGLSKLSQKSTILVVGLGNWNITPDALGPKVIDKILVTRHLDGVLPEEIQKSVRSVAAISPGVMGITGIETVEIIQGVVEKLKPDLVIAIDALAARKFSRINSTIQMSDTGVAPGAGVGNKRMTLNEQTLGIPVIALGVPTVVDAATLINDTMDRMLEEMIAQTEQGSAFYEMLHNMDTDEKYKLIVDILNPYVGNMFVTPKEVDAVVERLANIIANAINIAIQPGITMEDINRFTY